MRLRANRGDRVFVVVMDSTATYEKDRVEVDPNTFEPIETDSNIPRKTIRNDMNRYSNKA